MSGPLTWLDPGVERYLLVEDGELMRDQVTRHWAGLRPVTPDFQPILGRDPDRPSVIYACGHSRNGILMAPLTGDCVAALACGEEPWYDLSPFSVARFESGSNV